MKQIRAAESRGHANHGWLQSHHSFSFADYYDPEHMGVSILRVINDDHIAPSGGFPTHPHRDMEIVTYLMQGALEHRDSMGNGSVIRPGDIQRMSAGSGIRHSEFNPSDSEPTRLLQIWLLPNRQGISPGYAQQNFALQQRRGRLQLLVSPDGRDGSLSAQQDGLLYGTLLEQDQTLDHDLAPGRTAYVHLARGRAEINGEPLNEGDAITLTDETRIGMRGIEQAEILLFDLP